MSRGFWILLAITLVSVGASIFDFKWKEHQVEQKKESMRVIPVAKEDIEKIEISDSVPNEVAGTGVKLEKKEGKWNLISPIQDEADYSQVTDVLGVLSSEVYEKQVASGMNIDFRIYGLDASSRTRRIKIFGSNLPKDGYSVIRGSHKNFESKVYLKPEFGEPRVLLASPKWDSIFDRDDFSLRDKRMLRSSEGLNEIHVKTINSDLQLISKDGMWVAKNKPDFKLDQNKVREYLYVFTSPAILAYNKESNPSEDELTLYGFKQSQSRVSLTFENGQIWEAKFGLDKDGQYFVWLVSDQKVVRISQSDFQKVAEVDWRHIRDRREPFDFKSETYQRIKISKSEAFIEAERKDNKWVKTHSSNSDFAVDDLKVASLLDQLAVLSVEEFIHDLNLSKKDKVDNFSWQIELSNQMNANKVRLSFGAAMNLEVNNVKKSLIPVRSSLRNELVFISEGDFNKLGISDFLKNQGDLKKEGSP